MSTPGLPSDSPLSTISELRPLAASISAPPRPCGFGTTACHSTAVSPQLATAPTVLVYGRPGCHLCDDALRILREAGCQPTYENISSDPQLIAQFETCIPVVLIDGKIRFRGRVNEILLRRLLPHAAVPIPAP